MYQAIYKCRLCGEIVIDEIIMQPNIANEIMRAISFGNKEFVRNAPHPVFEYDCHFCKDGSLGLVDFQGFKNVEKLENEN